MNLKLLRTKVYPTHTSGQLYIDDEFFCFTLEDVVREVESKSVSEWKVKGETAIPRGVYAVGLEDSPRFGPDTITLFRVPGFTHIRIHAGNTDKDTEGCIIVGYKITDKGVIVPGTTRPAVADLRTRIKKSQPVTIQVI